MAGCFTFKGHEAVGAHVRRRLGRIGWRHVDDVARADVAFTYFAGAGALEDAYFDGDGLVKNPPAGMLLVDLSPATPSFAREVSAVASVNDLAFVEAPLAVRDLLAAPEFACFAACEDSRALERASELLGAIASPVELVERVGEAQLAKAADTVRKTAALVGAVEAAALGHAVREAAREADLAAGAGRPGGFPVELVMADVAAAMAAADDVDLILPQLEAAMHLLELLAVIGGAEMAPSALSLLYREEEAGAACGLDWARAEGFYEDAGHDRASGGGLGAFYEDDDSSGLGHAGGFGGFSEN